MISSEEPIGPQFMSYIWAKCINHHMFTSNGTLMMFWCLVRGRDFEFDDERIDERRKIDFFCNTLKSVYEQLGPKVSKPFTSTRSLIMVCVWSANRGGGMRLTTDGSTDDDSPPPEFALQEVSLPSRHPQVVFHKKVIFLHPQSCIILYAHRVGIMEN